MKSLFLNAVLYRFYYRAEIAQSGDRLPQIIHGYIPTQHISLMRTGPYVK